MILMFENIDDSTPIDPDEAIGLLPRHIQFQKELNEWEQLNIQNAREWVFSKHKIDILSVEFLRDLHRRMFNKTWEWAGKYRRTQKNIGIEAVQIPIELKVLMDDIIYWLNHKTFSIEEIAIRIHHRLVLIHPFPNGNGRFSRLYTDLFLKLQKQLVFHWGMGNLLQTGELRKRYIAALKKADRGDYEALLLFCR